MTLGDFPAPMSLCAITSLIGVFMTAAVQLFQDHKLEVGLPFVSVGDIIGYSVLVNMPLFLQEQVLRSTISCLKDPLPLLFFPHTTNQGEKQTKNKEEKC